VNARLFAAGILFASIGANAVTPLHFDGEIFARESVPISPPSIDNTWQFTLTQLAGDGANVKKGDVVATFDGAEIGRQLATKSSSLQEKISLRDKLKLELAERERTTKLDTSEQRSKLDKAIRKASQPENLMARVDYAKLLAERQQAERQMVLLEKREALALAQRDAEWRLAVADVAQLQAEVEQLQHGMQSLQVAAPRDGVMLHLTRWNGEKIDVGTQVWRGMSVAQIPNLDTLAVRAQVPERDIPRVTVGQAVRVGVDGSSATLAGHIAELGRVVRSKSSVQPVPVLDAVVVLDEHDARLKPGQSVRVDMQDAGTPGAPAP
jgi:HlyD family secretion protein